MSNREKLSIISIMIVMVLSKSSHAQVGLRVKTYSDLKTTTTSSILKPKKTFEWKDLWTVSDGVKFTLSLAYGPETIQSGLIPKMSLYYFYPTDTKIKGFSGIETSLWLAGFLMYTVDVTSGFYFGPIVFESTISLFVKPNSKNQNGVRNGRYIHAAINPKIGLFIYDLVWIKFGPSFIFYKDYDPREWKVIEPLRNGVLQYNYELTFNMPLEEG